MGRKMVAVFLCAFFIGLCTAQFNTQTTGQRQFLGNGQPFAGNNQQPGANQLGINSQGGLNPGSPGTQGVGNQLNNQNTQQTFAPNQQQGGFIQNQQPGGFLQNQQPGGFPQNQQQGGFNPNQQPGGTIPQNQQPGGTFPQTQGGFLPNQGGFPQPQQTGGFPPNPQGGFAQNNVGFVQNRPAGGFLPNAQPGAFANTPTGGLPNTPSVGLGGFQPTQLGGFNTVGNRFGNPFVVGGGVGNPFLQGGGPGGPTQPDNQNQFTAGGQLFMSLAQNPNNYRYGTCYLNSSDNAIKGRADFRQFLFGDSGVDIRIQVVGLPTSPVDTQRGIHIHEYGDTGRRCSRVGPHFNPSQTRHGGRNSFPFLRHVGDLGNMLQSAQGVASTQFRDNVISLQGRSSIYGRSLVIKLERDDEGTGTNSASQQNGNARTPIACCTISRASPTNWATPYSEQDLMELSGTAWNTNSGNLNAGNQNFNNQNGQTGFGGSSQNNQNFNTPNNNNFNTAAGGTNNDQSSFSFIGNNGK